MKEKLVDAEEWARQTKQESGALREDHLKELDETRAESRDILLEAETKSRITIEKQREQGRMLKCLKNEQFNAVDMVTTMENGVTRECTSKIQMEEAPFMEGNRRFSQT